jgi:hypothetical protein
VANTRKPNRRKGATPAIPPMIYPEPIGDEPKPKPRRRAAPRPVADRPERNPALSPLTDAQVWCRGFMHAWYLTRSLVLPFTVGPLEQTRLYWDCGNGCEHTKTVIHSADGKRWGHSRSAPPSAQVGRFAKDVFIAECFARGLIKERAAERVATPITAPPTAPKRARTKRTLSS